MSRSNRERLSDWFLQWHLPLRKFLLSRRRLPAADIDDVAQEVFLRILRFDKTALIENPQAYLFKVAANVASEWSLQACRRHPHEPRWLDDQVSDRQPDQQMLRESAQGRIEDAINTLTPGQRIVVKLFFGQGLRQSEIARMIGTTPRSVRRHLAKSYVKLRGELDLDLLRAISDDHE